MIDNRRVDGPAERTEGRPSPRTGGRSPREGFALPMAILVIAFLTVTIAAAYAATSSELATNTAQRGESRAYMIAQAGMEHFMARRNESGFCTQCELAAPPATTYESTTVQLPGGYSYVVAQRVRTADANRPAIYLLRSRGFDTTRVALGSKIGNYAERQVAQLVYWNVNQVNVLSGWTSATGLTKQGQAGAVSGVDECGAKSAVAGIAVPAGTYSSSGGYEPEGSPSVSYLGTTQSQLQAAVKIDWNGIVNGNRIQPDYTFANQAAADLAWPALKVRWATQTTFYPVIRVNGDFTINTLNANGGGRGTLIVLGDLDLNGAQLWDGIILVGGKMTSNGDGTVSGATESGLNALLTSTEFQAAQTKSSSSLDNPPERSVANGTKSFQYNSCEVAKAAGGLASYSVYPNAWMDNFVTY